MSTDPVTLSNSPPQHASDARVADRQTNLPRNERRNRSDGDADERLRSRRSVVIVRVHDAHHENEDDDAGGPLPFPIPPLGDDDDGVGRPPLPPLVPSPLLPPPKPFLSPLLPPTLLLHTVLLILEATSFSVKLISVLFYRPDDTSESVCSVSNEHRMIRLWPSPSTPSPLPPPSLSTVLDIVGVALPQVPRVSSKGHQ